MKTSVLVTGGAGFIGLHVVRELLRMGLEVSVLDNFSPQIHGCDAELPKDLRGEVKLIRGDVRDADIWQTALHGQQVIVHLAAETGTGQSMYEISRYEQVNLAGTANLYQWLATNPRHGVERIVTASSRAVYGEGAYSCSVHGIVYPSPRSAAEKLQGKFDPVCPACGENCLPAPTPETAPFQPLSFYGLTKQAQEQMALLFGRTFEIESFVLRYQNVYGPGQSLMNPYTGILAIFSNLVRAGKNINVFEDGLESRDFVFIDDIVRATAACITTASGGFHVMNVGSNQSITILEIANLINEFFGGRSKIVVSGAFREGDIRHAMGDLTRASTLIGYRPEWSFPDGLRQFLKWAAESVLEPSGYEQSLSEMKDRRLLHGA